MAKLGINTGIVPDDGLGDSLLDGAVKINDNFDEIYTYFGDGTNLTFTGGSSSQWVTTSAGIHTLSNVGIGTTNPTENLTVFGDARVTGILTIGTASITLDGSSNTITVGSGVTIDGSTGIIEATSLVVGGTTLTGAAVTSITAGSGISVDQSTGNVTISATGGSGGGESYWESTSVGINTLSNVGIGTTNPTSALTVKGNTSLETLSVSGVVTASSFNGNASTASFATVAGIATYTSEWILDAIGSSDYTFTGPGFTGAVSDPDLYLIRGQQYKFTNTMGAHPFRIQSTPNGSTGTQYNDGITNNDVSNGTLTWNVQFNAPGLLYYQCTAHGGMGGKIYIVDAINRPDISINTTGIITATSFTGNLINGELTNYAESLYAFGNTGATPSFALQNGNFVTATLNANVTSMTFDLTGCPTTTAAFGFTLVLSNDATPSRTITWPASVKWPNATVPTRTTTASKTDVYTFFTYDAGTTWWGNLSLYNFS